MSTAVQRPFRGGASLCSTHLPMQCAIATKELERDAKRGYLSTR